MFTERERIQDGNKRSVRREEGRTVWRIAKCVEEKPKEYPKQAVRQSTAQSAVNVTCSE